MPSLTEKVINLKHLVSLCTQDFTPDNSCEPETMINSYWSLIYINEGSAIITIGGRSYIADRNTATFISPNQIHSIVPMNDSGFTYTHAVFFLETIDDRSFKNFPVKCSPKEIERLSNATTNFSQAYQLLEKLSKKETKSQVAEANLVLYKTCLQCSYLSFENFLICFFDETAAPFQDSRKLIHHINIAASVEAYLSDHVRENISLEETALYFGYSVSSLQKIFKAITGESIIVYFNKLKLEEAKRLISQTNMNFSQISSYLGYSTSNYFSRIFKATVGLTPTEYASANQNKKSHNNEEKSDA